MSDEQEQAQKNDVAAADGPVPRLRLRSLKIHEFRDVRPGAELQFGDGFHLVLGKNGSGKSTLLQLLAAVSVLDFRGPFFEGTPFHLEASLTVGAIAAHINIRRKIEPVRMRSVGEQFIDLEPRDETDLRIRVEHTREHLCQWIWLRTGEDVKLFDGEPNDAKEPKLQLKFHGGSDPLALGASTAISNGMTFVMDGTYRVHPSAWTEYRWLTDNPGTGDPFDEALGALRAIVGGGLVVVRGDVFRSTSAWLPPALNFDGRGEPKTIELSKHPLFAQVLDQLGFDDAKAYFGPGASIHVGYRYSSPSFQFFHKGKAVRRHDQLSFGQKRLFSFAWYLACNPDIAIADELVNGLHSDWIDWCVQTLSDRQSFLTSQNPILVDSIPFRSADDIRRGIILCETVHNDATGSNELCFRQLDDAETDLLTRAFEQSRLDLLSDLLHALELW